MTPEQTREMVVAGAWESPVYLERLFYGWLSGSLKFDDWLDEARITDLRGPGYLPCDESGSEDADDDWAEAP